MQLNNGTGCVSLKLPIRTNSVFVPEAKSIEGIPGSLPAAPHTRPLPLLQPTPVTSGWGQLGRLPLLKLPRAALPNCPDSFSPHLYLLCAELYLFLPSPPCPPTCLFPLLPSPSPPPSRPPLISWIFGFFPVLNVCS